MLGRGGKSLPRLLWVGGHLPGGRLRPPAVFILFPPQSLSTQAFYQGPIWWPTPLVSLSGQLGPSYIFRRQPQSGQGHFRDGEADGPGSEGALGGEGWPEASVQARVPSPC